MNKLIEITKEVLDNETKMKLSSIDHKMRNYEQKYHALNQLDYLMDKVYDHVAAAISAGTESALKMAEGFLNATQTNFNVVKELISHTHNESSIYPWINLHRENLLFLQQVLKMLDNKADRIIGVVDTYLKEHNDFIQKMKEVEKRRMELMSRVMNFTSKHLAKVNEIVSQALSTGNEGSMKLAQQFAKLTENYNETLIVVSTDKDHEEFTKKCIEMQKKVMSDMLEVLNTTQQDDHNALNRTLDTVFNFFQQPRVSIPVSPAILNPPSVPNAG